MIFPVRLNRALIYINICAPVEGIIFDHGYDLLSI